jgi:lipopolysaccharide export system protein LptA
VCWRTEARVLALTRLLQLLLLAPLSAASLAAASDEVLGADAASTPGPASAQREGCNEPLCYTASKLEAERSRMVLHDISIVDTTRGITRIKADLAEANGQDLGNSEWVLTGHVQVFMPQGRLRADRATVQFVNKRIASMSAQGEPAEFERIADTSAQNAAPLDPANRSRTGIDTAHGHARVIDYDMESELLKLNGDSWLTDGCNEINSQSIVYDIVNQKVRADAAPGGDTQVHGTLHARSGPQCGPGVKAP